MSMVINRPVAVVRPAATPAKRQEAKPESTLGPSRSLLYTYQPGLNALGTIGQNAVVGGRWTPPLIVDLFKNSFLGAFTRNNLAWFIIPSSFRNVRNVIQQKISGARAAANVATETTFGIAKGIVSGTMVQASSIAVAPLLGRLPIPPQAMPLVSIGVSLLTVLTSYRVMNTFVAKTNLDRKMSDALTRLFGGDKRPQASSKSGAPASEKAKASAATPTLRPVNLGRLSELNSAR